MRRSVKETRIFAIFVYLITSIQYSLSHAECEIPKKDIYSSDVTVFCDGDCLSFCIPTTHWMPKQKQYNCTFSLITSDIKSLTLNAPNPNLNVEMLKCNLPTASVLKAIKNIGLKPYQTLILNGTKFFEIDALNGFEEITDLRLINVPMDDVLDENLFEKFKMLTRLDLVNNSIHALPENIFQNQKNLRTLNLANNNLTSMPETIFNNVPKLERLDLSGNQLKHIQMDLFNDLENFDELNLSNNQFDLTEFEGMQLSFKNLILESNKTSKYLNDLRIFQNLTDYVYGLSEYLNETNFGRRKKSLNCDCDGEAVQNVPEFDTEKIMCENNITLAEQIINCKNRTKSIIGFYIFMFIFIIGVFCIVGVFMLCDKYDQRVKSNENVQCTMNQ